MAATLLSAIAYEDTKARSSASQLRNQRYDALVSGSGVILLTAVLMHVSARIIKSYWYLVNRKTPQPLLLETSVKAQGSSLQAASAAYFARACS